jgi:hypothetical protein
MAMRFSPVTKLGQGPDSSWSSIGVLWNGFVEVFVLGRYVLCFSGFFGVCSAIAQSPTFEIEFKSVWLTTHHDDVFGFAAP